MPAKFETIYDKYWNGVPMTMDQLRAGHAHFEKLAALLGESGPIFALAAREARRTAFDLEGLMHDSRYPWRNAHRRISHNVRS